MRFLGAYLRPEGKISVVLEFMDRGSLQDLIERERGRLKDKGCGDGVSSAFDDRNSIKQTWFQIFHMVVVYVRSLVMYGSTKTLHSLYDEIAQRNHKV